MKRLSIALVLLGVVTSLAAAQHPNQSRGFSADGVYDFQHLDSVNMFNGGMTLRIPLGPEYKINGGFTYRFALTYNSNLWHWHTVTNINPYPGFPRSGGDPTWGIAEPDPRSNAAFGWIFSLGRLFNDPDCACFVFESPDGGDHKFQFVDAQGNSTAGDLTYLRLKNNRSNGLMTVNAPDGVTYTFKSFNPTTWVWDQNGNQPWYLIAINDTLGNQVSISYSSSEAYQEIWTISDSAGRVSVASFNVVTPEDPKTRMTLLRKLEQRSFGQTAAQDFGAVYDFVATSGPVVVPRPPRDNTNLDQHRVYELLEIQLPPDANNVRAKYKMTDGTPYYQNDSVAPGVLRRLELPTGGAIEWDYEPVDFSGGSAAVPSLTSSVAVSERRMVSPSWPKMTDAAYAGQTPLLLTQYHHFRGYHECAATSCPSQPTVCKPIVHRQMTGTSTTVRPDGVPVTTIAYFSLYRGGNTRKTDYCDRGNWHTWEYGLPLTHYEDSDAQGRSLSTEIREGAIDWTTFANPDLRAAGRVPTGNSRVIQETWVRYSADSSTVMNDDESTDDPVFDINRREESRKTVEPYNTALNSDPIASHFCGDSSKKDCWAITDSIAASYDGYGHYRQTVTTNNAPGVNARTSFTNYQAPSATLYNTSTYTEQCVADASVTDVVADCAGLSGPSSRPVLTTKFSFDPATALL